MFFVASNGYGRSKSEYWLIGEASPQLQKGIVARQGELRPNPSDAEIIGIFLFSIVMSIVMAFFSLLIGYMDGASSGWLTLVATIVMLSIINGAFWVCARRVARYKRYFRQAVESGKIIGLNAANADPRITAFQRVVYDIPGSYRLDNWLCAEYKDQIDAYLTDPDVLVALQLLQKGELSDEKRGALEQGLQIRARQTVEAIQPLRELAQQQRAAEERERQRLEAEHQALEAQEQTARVTANDAGAEPIIKALQDN